MHTAVVVGILLAAAPAGAQKIETPPPRFGIEADLEGYKQDTPKAALASVVKAIDGRRFDYLAAHLADPDVVDKRVQELDGKFQRYVKTVADRFTEDGEAVRQLRRFLSEGEFNVSGDAAMVSHKEIKGKQVFLRRVSSRWFLEDRQKAAKGNQNP